MKFTKKNMERVFDKFMQGGDSLADLKESILNLVDTPEKVVVPKFVADYLKERKRDEDGLFPSLYHFQHNFEDWSIKDWIEEEENVILFTKAWIDGYEVEKEPLFCVNINGQFLVKMIPERNVHKFVEEVKLCVWDTQAYQLTEEEIKEIDERYWLFAVQVNGEK